MLQIDFAAILSEQCRPTKTPTKALTRAIAMIPQVDMTGGTFSFFMDELDSKQLHLAISLYRKAGLIELSREAVTGKVKAGYRLTANFLPSSITESRPDISSYPYNEAEDDWELEDYDGDIERDPDVMQALSLLHESNTSFDDRYQELSARVASYDEYDLIIDSLASKSASVAAIVSTLQEGSKTFKELLSVSTSRSSLIRALRQLTEANLVTSAGAGRSVRIYSLNR